MSIPYAIRLCAFAVIGGSLSAAGQGLTSPIFWIVMLSVAVVDITSHIDAQGN